MEGGSGAIPVLARREREVREQLGCAAVGRGDPAGGVRQHEAFGGSLHGFGQPRLRIEPGCLFAHHAGPEGIAGTAEGLEQGAELAADAAAIPNRGVEPTRRDAGRRAGSRRERARHAPKLATWRQCRRAGVRRPLPPSSTAPGREHRGVRLLSLPARVVRWSARSAPPPPVPGPWHRGAARRVQSGDGWRKAARAASIQAHRSGVGRWRQPAAPRPQRLPGPASEDCRQSSRPSRRCAALPPAAPRRSLPGGGAEGLRRWRRRHFPRRGQGGGGQGLAEGCGADVTGAADTLLGAEAEPHHHGRHQHESGNDAVPEREARALCPGVQSVLAAYPSRVCACLPRHLIKIISL